MRSPCCYIIFVDVIVVVFLWINLGEILGSSSFVLFIFLHLLKHIFFFFVCVLVYHKPDFDTFVLYMGYNFRSKLKRQ